MESKVVYAYNQKEALLNFRKLTPDKYVASKAKFAGTKHNMRVYIVYFRLRKGEY